MRSANLGLRSATWRAPPRRGLFDPLLMMLGCLLGIIGCGEGRRAATVVTDSAGVRVTVTGSGPATFAELDGTPIVSIGNADVDGPTQFFRIQNVHVDPRGRFWVADGQSAELRLFRPDGSHWKTRGGRGEGPGEFLQIRLLGAIEGDSVLVGDGATDRLTVFDPDGDLVRSDVVPASDRAAPRFFDAFRDGSVLGQVPRIVVADSMVPGQILTDSVELVRVDVARESMRQYAAAGGPLWLWTGRSQVPIPFTVNASFVVVGETVHLVSGPDFRIRVFDAGRLLESYGVDRPRRPVSDRDVRSYRHFVDEYVASARRDDYLSALDHDRRPAVLPAYDRVLVAPDGHVWAQVYAADLSAAHDWHVFDETRAFVGRVLVPASFRPFDVGDTAVTGVWRDALGVEHVRSYRLLPG